MQAQTHRHTSVLDIWRRFSLLTASSVAWYTSDIALSSWQHFDDLYTYNTQHTHTHTPAKKGIASGPLPPILDKHSTNTRNYRHTYTQKHLHLERGASRQVPAFSSLPIVQSTHTKNTAHAPAFSSLHKLKYTAHKNTNTQHKHLPSRVAHQAFRSLNFVKV